MKWAIAGAALLVMTAVCHAQTAKEKPVSAKAAIGDFGLDLATLQSSVRPGDDFYAYANGKWLDTFQIPADRSSYGAFDKLEDLSEERVRQIIEAAAAGRAAAGSPEQKIGDYFSAFMDQKAIEANGLTPVSADLQRIAAAKSKDDIATLFGSPGFASLYDVDITPDLKDPNRYSVAISQSSLGLPDRDYYLNDDPKLQEIRQKYLAYVEQMLTLGGVPDAHIKAVAISEFETSIAKVQWPIEKRRDVEATYNPRTKAQLLKLAPGFPWQAFLDASQLGSRENLVLAELTAIQELGTVFKRTPLPTLQAYLTFHYLNDHAPYLPKRLDEARFGFYGQALRGQPEQRERWKRAVSAVDDALGEQVGQVYVAKYFPPESKAKVQELVANLRASLSDRIDHLDWMTAQTRSRAHEKLATFVTKIGYPDKWKDYSALEVRRDDLVGNVKRAAVWHWNYLLARLDKPVDRSEWQMTPQEINAYYNPQNNEIVFPAAILQPPFFDPNADDAVNYGAIGAIIGHEIGHGFDDQGRKFGPDGGLEDWWTPKDADEFTSRVSRLIKEYSQFEALPGLKVNGANTIGENIGDLGGLNMALHAYQLSLQGARAPVLGGLTAEQRFFLSWAQAWRMKFREGALREIVMSDVHSPARFRVNGTMPNIAEWYAAFGVQPGDKLFMKPQERVTIW
ncbi:MAG TPA: M13 family metallopeptidase [Steroidobacteraceae bacterium]|jgi:predicted metalloendopeptidase